MIFKNFQKWSRIFKNSYFPVSFRSVALEIKKRLLPPGFKPRAPRLPALTHDHAANMSGEEKTVGRSCCLLSRQVD